MARSVEFGQVSTGHPLPQSQHRGAAAQLRHGPEAGGCSARFKVENEGAKKRGLGPQPHTKRGTRGATPSVKDTVSLWPRGRPAG